MDTALDKTIITIGMRFGCLQILDEGTDYLQVMDERVDNILVEKDSFIENAEAGKYERRNMFSTYSGEENIPSYKYNPKSFRAHREYITISDFDEAISRCIKDKEIKHYKCKCRKCGKIRYYNEETLDTEPKVCYKPLYCSMRFSYSISANNANLKKRKKYENNESVCLLGDKASIAPGDEYCEAWNEKRKKELNKQAIRDAQILAAVPRKNAPNYDVDYVGLIYESLKVIECVNDALESVPVPHYNQRHQKSYSDITVYKEYRCKCYLCGNEKMITCDKFGIYPPTEYGYRAYGGYWSAVYCDCHSISSFQWIVNDILLKHSIDYRVEVEAEGLCGIDNDTPLRFDFAIYKDGEVISYIECQGEQHYMPVEEFGGERRFAIQQMNDEKKRIYARKMSIPLIEIPYKKKKYEVVESILRESGII